MIRPHKGTTLLEVMAYMSLASAILAMASSLLHTTFRCSPYTINRFVQAHTTSLTPPQVCLNKIARPVSF